MRTLWLALVLVGGCGDDGGGGTTTGDSGTDGTTTTGCTREPAAADRTRYVVVSHPYAPGGDMRSNAWEVLDLSATGTITRPGRTFMMGRAIVGEVAFTRDGKIGAVAQDDGSVGVFQLDDTGTPTVLQAMFKGEAYANKVVAAPDGSLYVLDNQWREHGGGIYKLVIDCDGNVSDSRIAEAKLPAGLVFRADGTALLAATDIGTSPMGAEGHVLAWNNGAPTVSGSSDLFPEDMAIVGGTAVTPSGSTFFVGDTSAFSSEPNSVVVASVTGASFSQAARIEIEDPFAIVADPDREQALVAAGTGDALYVVDKPAATWRSREVTYTGGTTQLPSGLAMLTAGSLRGHVFVGELSGVRHVRFTATGVEDLGLFVIGTEIEDSVGAVGVTP